MRKMIFGVLVLCALASPAGAHWQYTKWGMTPDQVIAASSGAAKAGSGEKSAQGDAIKGAVGTYAAGAFNFSVNYWFGSTGLAMVSLSLHDDQQCLALQRDLLAKYGEPVEHTGTSVKRRMWADKASDNRVALITTGLGFCELQYAPLISSAGAGL